MNVIIYGTGARFQRIFQQSTFSETALAKHGVQILGIVNSAPDGKTVTYSEKEFEVRDIRQFPKEQVDAVVITTDIYFQEIAERLLQLGYQYKQLFSIDQFFLAIYYDLGCLTNKRGIEIGGPSDLFRDIYDLCASCDGVNFSSSTVWWDERADHVFSYQGRPLGNTIIAEASDLCCVESEAYDFLLSSNNLEHIANPLLALREFARVVKSGNAGGGGGYGSRHRAQQACYLRPQPGLHPLCAPLG